jgi:glycosidase
VSRFAAVALLAFGGVVSMAGVSCKDDETASGPNIRQCGLVIWHKPASPASRVEIVGDWNHWARPGITPDSHPDGWRVTGVDASVGEHAYAIIEDGVWLTNRNEPMTGQYQDHEVSVGTAEDCTTPAVRVDSVETNGAGDANVRVTFLSAKNGAKVDPASVVARSRDGAVISTPAIDPATGRVGFALRGLQRGKYTYTIAAKDTTGKAAEDARATVWIDGTSEAWDPRDAIVYQVMIDRYRGPEGALKAPATPSSRAGGTLSGVLHSLDEIEALGASAIWLSPLYTNPEGDFPNKDGTHTSTSYHGYWPIDSRGIDSRFASEEELDSFVTAAHARGIRVLFDVVPNHVHEQHPWTKAHADWFKQDCVCGEGTCDWGAHIKTCWFAPYLPDLDWMSDVPAHAASDEVMWWFDRWDADGIRIDAVPMMPRSATRRIAAAARKRYQHPGHSLYVLGENFTGPGAYQSLRYDLGPYGLDGSFHFPLMWTMREAIAHETSPLGAIEASYREGEAAWDGANAVMGLMIGNHDVSRFSSESAGDADGDVWAGPPQPTDPIVYAKQRLALATVLTLPGAPVLYYGDEVGLAGRSDPDCRRVMPAEASLSPEQLQTRNMTRVLGVTRSCSRALRRGTLTTMLADEEHFVFARVVDGESAIVALTRRPTKKVEVPLPPGSPTDLVEVFSGKPLNATVLPVSDAPFSVQVYISAGSGCVVTQP